MLPWSKYQQAIFTNVASGAGHTHVAGVACSGKTSVILEGVHHVPSGSSTLICAPSKATQVRRLQKS